MTDWTVFNGMRKLAEKTDGTLESWLKVSGEAGIPAHVAEAIWKHNAAIGERATAVLLVNEAELNVLEKTAIHLARVNSVETLMERFVSTEDPYLEELYELANAIKAMMGGKPAEDVPESPPPTPLKKGQVRYGAGTAEHPNGKFECIITEERQGEESRVLSRSGPIFNTEDEARKVGSSILSMGIEKMKAEGIKAYRPHEN